MYVLNYRRSQTSKPSTTLLKQYSGVGKLPSSVSRWKVLRPSTMSRRTWAKCLTNLGLKSAVHIEHVLGNKHLTINIGTGADAENGDAYGFGDGLGHAVGYTLDHYGKDASGLEGLCVLNEPGRRLGCAALYLEAAEAGSALRCQADVAHDGDTCIDMRRMVSAMLRPPSSLTQSQFVSMSIRQALRMACSGLS